MSWPRDRSFGARGSSRHPTLHSREDHRRLASRLRCRSRPRQRNRCSNCQLRGWCPSDQTAQEGLAVEGRRQGQGESRCWVRTEIECPLRGLHGSVPSRESPGCALKKLERLQLVWLGALPVPDVSLPLCCDDRRPIAHWPC